MYVQTSNIKVNDNIHSTLIYKIRNAYEIKCAIIQMHLPELYFINLTCVYTTKCNNIYPKRSQPLETLTNMTG